MMYRTKVEVVTGEKTYKLGSILPADISASDLAFLKAKKFVVPADVAPFASDITEDETGDDEGDDGEFPGFDEMQPGKLKSTEEIRKIRAKKEIRAYADSIGLNLGDNYEEKSLKELQEIVINFQDEIANGKDNEAEGE